VTRTAIKKHPKATQPATPDPFTEKEIEAIRRQINGTLVLRFLATIDVLRKRAAHVETVLNNVYECGCVDGMFCGRCVRDIESSAVEVSF
jgi:hypothetical protein